jgi:hypothetical protein
MGGKHMKPRNIIITFIVIVAGVFAGHFLGLYTLPFLTEEVNAISVLETTGTVNVERPPETPPPDDTPPAPRTVEPLTPEQQTMVGVWEDEDRLVAVRQRMGRDGNPDYDFIFDAITYNNGTWIKVTRETCTFEIVDDKYVVTDIYYCPLPDDPGGNLYEANNILEYDPETDTMFFSETHVTQNGLQTWTRTLTRTGRDPETDPDVDWSDYYRIHPDRE